MNFFISEIKKAIRTIVFRLSTENSVSLSPLCPYRFLANRFQLDHWPDSAPLLQYGRTNYRGPM